VVSVIVRKTVSVDMCQSEWSPIYLQNFLYLQMKSIVSSKIETEVT